MLNELKYHEKFDAVFRSIFANAVFVRNLVAGSRVSKNERFDCVTLEGSLINRSFKLVLKFKFFRRSSKPTWSNDGRFY